MHPTSSKCSLFVCLFNGKTLPLSAAISVVFKNDKVYPERHTNDQEVHEKVLNITNNKGDTGQ